ncbi:hypothetical protein HPB48_014494 [Haemaphysalis longicornis]|uniref:Ionotropic receptor n=1 Tax=Haemaphysalis longicornis TaxID=44386 RepID=A0A9J6GND6_HAELO|nr:hypothetical protein HPB48_014494 [Haemaphysalis longicornis]
MKVAKKKIILVRILWSMFNPLEASMYPLALDVMTNLKNHDFIGVAAFGNASKLLAPYITQLPKPIWLWTSFRQDNIAVPGLYPEQKRRLSKVVIFLPWLLNLPKGFPGTVDVFAMQAVHIHWVVSTDTAMPLDWIPKLRLGACQVLTVSRTYIDEPKNGFGNCALSRRNTSSAQVFRLREGDAKKYPRNLNLTIIHPNGDVSAVPEVAALIEAYASLNTSLNWLQNPIQIPREFFIRARLADIDIVPNPLFENELYNLYLNAMYPPCNICFFTRLVAAKGSFLARDSANIIVFISSFFLLALAIVIVSRSLDSRELHTKCSAVIFFLASTFLGRSPQTLCMAGVTLRTLLALWMFGTLIVGSYLQSYITTDICVKSLAHEVEDLQEFEKLLDERRILPCVDFSFLTTAVHYFKSPFLKKLAAVIRTRPTNCVIPDRQEGCYSLVHQGKYAYVRPCCSYDEHIAFRRGLVKGRGNLQMYHRVARMLPNLPHRRQHRRLLLAIFESGMDVHHERKDGGMHFDEGNILIPHPFSHYMMVFAIGCACSIMVFFAEVIKFSCNYT